MNHRIDDFYRDQMDQLDWNSNYQENEENELELEELRLQREILQMELELQNRNISWTRHYYNWHYTWYRDEPNNEPHYKNYWSHRYWRRNHHERYTWYNNESDYSYTWRRHNHEPHYSYTQRRNHYEANRWYNNEYQMDWNEYLPQIVYPKIISGSVYHNGDIWRDYYEQLTSISISNDLQYWLNKNSQGSFIELNFWNRIERVDVSYQWEYIVFTLNWRSQSILLNEINNNKTFLVNFWDNIEESQRWQQHWKFIEFAVQLNW